MEVNQQLRFAKHLETIICKGKKRINIMKCMAGKDWGSSMEDQRKVYLQYVRTVLEYASEGWSLWLAPTNMQKLERVQNEALRTASRLAKGCPVDFLRLETNVEPLELRLQKNDEILWDRYERLPITDARNQLIKREVPPRLTTRHGFRIILCEKSCLGVISMYVTSKVQLKSRCSNPRSYTKKEMAVTKQLAKTFELNN